MAAQLEITKSASRINIKIAPAKVIAPINADEAFWREDAGRYEDRALRILAANRVPKRRVAIEAEAEMPIVTVETQESGGNYQSRRRTRHSSYQRRQPASLASARRRRSRLSYIEKQRRRLKRRLAEPASSYELNAELIRWRVSAEVKSSRLTASLDGDTNKSVLADSDAGMRRAIKGIKPISAFSKASGSSAIGEQ